jgi:hypothetical protein
MLRCNPNFLILLGDALEWSFCGAQGHNLCIRHAKALLERDKVDVLAGDRKFACPRCLPTNEQSVSAPPPNLLRRLTRRISLR